MINSESHRQFYLAVAGIRMWYARRPLPAAAPSPEYQFTDDEMHEPQAVPAQLKPAQLPGVEPRRSERPGRQGSVDLQSLMASPVKKEEPVAPVQDNSPRPPGESDDTPGERPENLSAEVAGEAFIETANHSVISAQLVIWATEKTLLISQWSGEASERLQDSLAGNLLGALGQTLVGERQMLHWPVFRNPQVPGNSPDDLQKVLASLVSPFADRSVILLGVLSNEPQEQREHCLESVLPRVGVDFPWSLAELSATPAHKRDLWNALKSCYRV